ncbi:MAG: AlkZ family DNA glycosylase [Actinomycetales bacterium]|nr:AlkZ family DNA glycosylase [Actinomycetales bacterium]
MPETLTVAAALRLRMRAQGLDPRSALDPVAAADRAVALQGQDLPAVLRALAIRSRRGTTLDAVRAAFDRGELVRTWTMRGTLFATTPRRAATLLALTGERVRASIATRKRQLGLDPATVERGIGILREALASGTVTRADAMARWEAAGIPTREQRGYHLILEAGLTGLAWWGPFVGADQALVAADPVTPADLEAALDGVVRGYLRAHGPVDPDDAAWWLGLPKTPVRAAVERVRPEFAEVEVAGRTMLVDPGVLAGGRGARASGRVVLVPGFDELVLGYPGRELFADPEVLAALTPGNNGVFQPAVAVDGRVVGTWRVPVRGESRLEILSPVSDAVRARAETALADWPY